MRRRYPPYVHVPEIQSLAPSRMRFGQVGHGQGIQRIATSERILGLENVNEDGYRAVVVVEVAQRAGGPRGREDCEVGEGVGWGG